MGREYCLRFGFIKIIPRVRVIVPIQAFGNLVVTIKDLVQKLIVENHELFNETLLWLRFQQLKKFSDLIRRSRTELIPNSGGALVPYVVPFSRC